MHEDVTLQTLDHCQEHVGLSESGRIEVISVRQQIPFQGMIHEKLLCEKCYGWREEEALISSFEEPT